VTVILSVTVAYGSDHVRSDQCKEGTWTYSVRLGGRVHVHLSRGLRGGERVFLKTVVSGWKGAELENCARWSWCGPELP
jgi:hypothetical protein